MKTPMQRFMDKVVPEPMSGCWLWFGSSCSKSGYGTFCANRERSSTNRVKYAHRFAYEAFVGPIPSGRRHVVRHTCDNPACVNPDHLQLGSQQQNIEDRERRGRTLGAVKSSVGLPRHVQRCAEWDKTGKGYRTAFRFRGKRYSAGAFATAEEAGRAIADLWASCYHSPLELPPPTETPTP